MNNVDTQIENLQRELDELKQQRKLEQEKAKVKQWEPQGGCCWYVGLRGVPCVTSHTTEDIVQQWASFGLTYPTQALALKAAKQMRKHNRLLAYVHEHAPEWDGGDDAWAVYYSKSYGCYQAIRSGCMADLGSVTMPEHVAEKLAQQLNNGSVVL